MSFNKLDNKVYARWCKLLNIREKCIRVYIYDFSLTMLDASKIRIAKIKFTGFVTSIITLIRLIT